jgi:cytochrome P450
MQGEVYHSYMEVLLGHGIFNVDGELWKRQRKTASLEFASRNLRDFSSKVFKEYALKLSTILSQSSFLNQQIDMQVLQIQTFLMLIIWFKRTFDFPILTEFVGVIDENDIRLHMQSWFWSGNWNIES